MAADAPADDHPRRETIATEPDDDGILFARLAPGPHRNFVYLIGDAEEGVASVIDPAFDVARILDVLDRWDCTLKDALFTHNHWDHIEGAPVVRKTTGCTLRIHEADAPALAQRDISVEAFESGETIPLGRFDVVAHHTPGHTAGGTTYQCGKRLFTGDFLFTETCGRADFPTGSVDSMWTSLQWFKQTFGDDHVICPGHDYGATPEVTVAEAKRTNAALRHTEPAAFADEWFLRAY